MAKPVDMLKKILANSKARIIFIVASALVLLIVIVIVIRAFRGNDMVSGAAAVAPIPGSIQSEPGVAQQNDKYLQTLLQSNQQEARTAIQAGQTEIPTLVPTNSSANSNNFNAQGLPATQAPAPCCCQQCLNGAVAQTNDAGGVIAQMENAGQVSPVLAGQLKQLQAEGLSPEDYQKRLQALVQSGQLTPDQAQKLYDAYKNKAGTGPSSDDLVNQLASSGNIDAATAAAIKALNPQNLSPDDYAAKINDLVKAGKLSAADAQKLIAAYNASKGVGAAGQGPMDPNALVNQMAADGSMSADTAAALKALNSQGLTPDQYANKLNDLVKAGKLKPDQARKLLAAYAASQGTGTGPTSDQVVDQLGVSPDTAAALKALNKQGLSAGDYLSKVNAMVKAGKLKPDQAKQLLNAYEQQLKAQQQASPADLIRQMLTDGSISPDTANELGLLGAKNLSPSDYKNELDKLVAAGKLTPAQAKLLFDAYTRQHAAGGTSGEAALAALSQAQEQENNDAANQALDDEQAQLAEANQQAMQAEVQSMQAAVSSQAGKLFAAWNVSTQSPSGQFVDAAPKGSSATPGAGGANGTGAGGATQGSPLVIRAGDVMFGVLDTAVNSDEQGPVMATIVSGKYKGAKLLGGLSLTSDQNGVVLNFTKMTMPDWPAAVSINAVAISPETARTALADNVNHHYFMRYGSVFASSFLQGVGQAIQQSGQTQVNNAGTSTSTFANLSIGQQAMVGFGQVGQNLGNAAQNTFNTPNTVTIKSGSGLGVLFQNDVSLAAVQSATPDSVNPSNSSTNTNTTTTTTQKNESTFATGEQNPVAKTQ